MISQELTAAISGFMLLRFRAAFEFEISTQVVLPYYRVGGQFFGCAVEKYLTLKQQIGSIGDRKRLIHIMVCDKDANVLILQPPHHILNLLHGYRVNTCKRLVQHHKLRLDGQATGYLRAPALATTEAVTQVETHMLKIELFDQLFQLLTLILLGERSHLQNRKDIVLHRHFPEHRRFLRQIAYTQLCTFVHRVRCDIRIVKKNLAVVGGHQTGGHIERSGLTRSVRTEQAYYLTLLKVDTHIVDNRSFAVLLV